MKMNSISITNIETYHKLKQIFKGKDPTDRTILIWRLLLEGHINEDEAKIIIDNDKFKAVKNGSQRKGGGFNLVHQIQNTNLSDNRKLK